MNAWGTFHGIGVGPGAPGLVPVAACEILQQAGCIVAPRATSAEHSVARQCVAPWLPRHAEWIDLSFDMQARWERRTPRYARLAERLAEPLQAGRDVVYLTLGDPSTYSTYGYALDALRARLPGVHCHTIPGVSAFAAAAATFDWPLGRGKERVLLLPCPDDMEALRRDIESHDVVVLMKLAHRLPAVIDLLRQMGIEQHCALAHRLGLEGEKRWPDLSEWHASRHGDAGYLATLLIRRAAPGRPT